MRCVYGAKFNAHTNPLFILADTLKFHELVKLNTVKIIHSCLHSELPKGLEKMFKKTVGRTRSADEITIERPNCKAKGIFEWAHKYWEEIPSFFREIGKPNYFKGIIKSHYICQYLLQPPCSTKNCRSCTESLHTTQRQVFARPRVLPLFYE